jgi:hypothetical protein
MARIKSKAQRRKFAELLVEGKIDKDAYERWNRGAGIGGSVGRRTGRRDAAGLAGWTGRRGWAESVSRSDA